MPPNQSRKTSERALETQINFCSHYHASFIYLQSIGKHQKNTRINMNVFFECLGFGGVVAPAHIPPPSVCPWVGYRSRKYLVKRWHHKLASDTTEHEWIGDTTTAPTWCLRFMAIMFHSKRNTAAKRSLRNIPVYISAKERVG